ncbi:Uncharacterised protein (plasmid) [Tsukamurella tyrosinosolvens]|uniref:Uncharacterized protein n=1 Tax=Tsukamurella tyrosinosolvens TaxID=57704 RepID=A0A1H4U9Q2_TSUTY|nr:hypothetical protein [Tsukamurella tyrosinosolvens]SEC65397.1 hypothetical protein SAMN04489793_2824 [Tsukamurella tyrosinosolvens]VEH94074.1 Uncharacterised protein [Tsukamurella tyrosinosolvens]
MTVYNVRASVIEDIEANTAEAAVAEFLRRLRAAKFEVYEDAPYDVPSAIERD